MNIYEQNFADFPTVEPVPGFNGLFEQPSTGAICRSSSARSTA